MSLTKIRTFGSIPFVRDIMTMQAGRGVYMAATLVANIIFARVLGPDAFGVYAVALAFVATIRAFCTLGQASALQVFFAEQFGKHDREGMASVLKNTLLVNLGNACVLLALLLAAPWLSLRLYGDPLVGSYGQILLLFSILDLWNGSVLVLLQATRSIASKTILEQAQNLGFLFAACVAVLMGYGVYGLLYAQLAVSAVFLPISFVVLVSAGKTPSLPLGLHEILRAPGAKALHYFQQSIWIALDKNIGGLYPSGLFFILSLVAPAYAVGLARIALQLATVPSSILLPQVGELSATVLAMMTENTRKLRMNAVRVIKHTLAIHAAMTIAAMCALPFVIRFYGERYTSAMPIALWLLLLSLFSPLAILNSSLLRLYRKIHFSFFTAMLMMICMWSCIYFLADLIGPIKSFLGAYLIGQLLPLALTLYLFLALLRRPSHV